MFGIGGGEIVFIILIALMLFGSENIPNIARTLGKGIAQIKNATDDIKSEIQRSAEENGLDVKSLTGGLNDEIEKVKGGFNKMVNEHTQDLPVTNLRDIPNTLNDVANDVTKDVTSELDTTTQSLDDIEAGPIKRQG